MLHGRAQFEKQQYRKECFLVLFKNALRAIVRVERSNPFASTIVSLTFFCPNSGRAFSPSANVSDPASGLASSQALLIEQSRSNGAAPHQA